MSNWKFTTIMHGPRIKMGLSVLQYCVFDIYYNSQTNPDHSVNGWAMNSYSEIGRFLGVSKGTVFNIVEKGVEGGFLEVNPADPRLKKTTKKWYKNAYENRSENERNTNRSKTERSKTERSKTERNRSETERQKSKTVQKLNESVQELNAINKIDNNLLNINKEKENAHAKNPTEQKPKKDAELTAEATLEKEKSCAKKEKEPVLVDDGFLTDPVPEEIPDLGGPDWMTVAQDMARYYEDPNGRGPSEWEMQCMAAGGYVKPLIITTIWAGKNQDAPYLLKNWKKHTGKLTNWIKNNLKSDRQHEAKIKSLNNGKRKSTDPLITGDAMAKAYRELMAEGYR